MSDWLGTRRPPAPEDLARRVAQAVDEEAGRGAGPLPDDLIRAGLRRLDAARAEPGRVRESAFELLVADALVTYACEAALESDDVSETLERLVGAGGDPR